MKHVYYAVIVLLQLFASTTTHAATSAITWNGATSSDLFDESNWTLAGSATTFTIEPGVRWSTDTDNTLDIVLNSGAAATGGPGGNGNLRTDDGGASVGASLSSLTLDGDASLLITQLSGSGAITGTASSYDPALRFPITLNGTAVLQTAVLWGSSVTLNDASRYVFGATGTSLLQVSDIDFNSLDATVHAPQPPAYYLVTPHNNIDGMTVFGAAAVPGVNLFLLDDGLGGTIFSPVPEPASMVLLTAGCLALLRQRA